MSEKTQTPRLSDQMREMTLLQMARYVYWRATGYQRVSYYAYGYDLTVEEDVPRRVSAEIARRFFSYAEAGYFKD